VHPPDDNRRALRVALNVPTVIDVIDQPPIELHPVLARVYQRVEVNRERVGQRFPGAIRDLSTNGAFIAGEALPLLSRVTFTFELQDFGPVTVFGWTLWRRESDCEVPRLGGATAMLPRGFGVLFEAIPLDARIAIHRLVSGARG
jgi:hypothetical protein